jgi:hypothetical protein
VKFESILEWFSGKSLYAIVNFTIPALIECEELGYWKKGVARAVRATLNKQNEAAKWARGVEKVLDAGSYTHPLHDALSDMRYGSYGRANHLLTPAAKTKRLGKNRAGFSIITRRGAENVNETIDRWAAAFAPVSELLVMLDERRPKPVIVLKTLSPTVAANVSKYIGIDLRTIQAPPMRGIWVDMLDKKGKSIRVWQVEIVWPEGTRHNQSKFLHSHDNQLCQACGHAIRNGFNWVPLLAYGCDEPLSHCASLAPFSLWVGRDCARKLFGCEIEGDAIYTGRVAA